MERDILIFMRLISSKQKFLGRCYLCILGVFLLWAGVACKVTEIESEKARNNDPTLQEVFNSRKIQSKLDEVYFDTLLVNWDPQWPEIIVSQINDSTIASYIPLKGMVRNSKYPNIPSKQVLTDQYRYLIMKNILGRYEFHLGIYTPAKREYSHNYRLQGKFTGSLDLDNLETDGFSVNNYIESVVQPKAVNSRTNYLQCNTYYTCRWGGVCSNDLIILQNTSVNTFCSEPRMSSSCFGSQEFTMAFLLEHYTSETDCVEISEPFTPDGGGGSVDGDGNVMNSEFTKNMVFVGPKVAILNIKDYLNCFSQNVDIALSYKVKIFVDQPKASALNPFYTGAEGKHKVGHAFVELEMVMPRSNIFPAGQTIRKTIGFYPKDNADPVYPQTRGTLGRDEYYDGSVDISASFTATKSEFISILELTEAYSNKIYDLYNRNCANYTSDVLNKLGVVIPNTWQQTFWFVTPVLGEIKTITGPSVGVFGEEVKKIVSPKLISKSISEEPKPDTGNCK